MTIVIVLVAREDVDDHELLLVNARCLYISGFLHGSNQSSAGAACSQSFSVLKK